MAGPPLHAARHRRLEHQPRRARRQGERPGGASRARGRRGAVRGGRHGWPDRGRRAGGPGAVFRRRARAGGGQQGRPPETGRLDLGTARARSGHAPPGERIARPRHRRPAGGARGPPRRGRRRVGQFRLAGRRRVGQLRLAGRRRVGQLRLAGRRRAGGISARPGRRGPAGRGRRDVLGGAGGPAPTRASRRCSTG